MQQSVKSVLLDIPQMVSGTDSCMDPTATQLIAQFHTMDCHAQHVFLGHSPPTKTASLASYAQREPIPTPQQQQQHLALHAQQEPSTLWRG
jgi:hypothetical protein